MVKYVSVTWQWKEGETWHSHTDLVCSQIEQKYLSYRNGNGAAFCYVVTNDGNPISVDFREAIQMQQRYQRQHVRRYFVEGGLEMQVESQSSQAARALSRKQFEWEGRDGWERYSFAVNKELIREYGRYLQNNISHKCMISTDDASIEVNFLEMCQVNQNGIRSRLQCRDPETTLLPRSEDSLFLKAWNSRNAILDGRDSKPNNAIPGTMDWIQSLEKARQARELQRLEIEHKLLELEDVRFSLEQRLLRNPIADAHKPAKGEESISQMQAKYSPSGVDLLAKMQATIHMIGDPDMDRWPSENTRNRKQTAAGDNWLQQMKERKQTVLKRNMIDRLTAKAGGTQQLERVATRLQGGFRIAKAKRQVRKIRAEARAKAEKEKKAVTEIQSVIRSKSARKLMRTMAEKHAKLEKEKKAAVILQRNWREYIKYKRDNGEAVRKAQGNAKDTGGKLAIGAALAKAAAPALAKASALAKVKAEDELPGKQVDDAFHDAFRDELKQRIVNLQGQNSASLSSEEMAFLSKMDTMSDTFLKALLGSPAAAGTTGASMPVSAANATHGAPGGGPNAVVSQLSVGPLAKGTGSAAAAAASATTSAGQPGVQGGSAAAATVQPGAAPNAASTAPKASAPASQQQKPATSATKSAKKSVFGKSPMAAPKSAPSGQKSGGSVSGSSKPAPAAPPAQSSKPGNSKKSIMPGKGAPSLPSKAPAAPPAAPKAAAGNSKKSIMPGKGAPAAPAKAPASPPAASSKPGNSKKSIMPGKAINLPGKKP